uniref:Deacetylase sirtuin-type domain-containing protein n=1 Tax=Neobodo designis TaxID=312471 RepID=A0A7S1MAE3_NEODS|mmetsp:Transcript_36803/g.113557  ORF Transcript_36803/g.113557 Transcript_36803/m.113557 type:complete len:411 (+) Transcript_36803:53-1285(+)|eukprot:CAMPEP_0174854378 /NCGR_PEP_ID=MMETSP1114-20130205/30987_1 /TAXON_ID=312471 /ORGANISM="Neobodo designis, Strain CCAP 1951/1" /LENGTH=410 /DNA_ID=CAMNT_0016089069 /DNA_START=52 /DNA_END=1284 /DNA_ORIENTATION=+
MGFWNWLKHAIVSPSADDKASVFATKDAPAPDPAAMSRDALHEARFAAVARGIKEGKYKNIVVLTGAGVSTAAGIPDFRSRAGMYELSKVFPRLTHSMAVFDAHYFREDPVPFYYIVNKIMKKRPDANDSKANDNTAAAGSPLASYDPTWTHSFLRLLEQRGVLLRVYTQNVDCMELAAGLDPSRLVQFHGTMADAKCNKCGKRAPLQEVKEALLTPSKDPVTSTPLDFTVPRCRRCTNPGATVKPNIVLFNEGIPFGALAQAAADFPRADLLLCIGSTFQVFPFAGLAAKVDDCVPRVLLNLEKVASGNSASNDAFGTSQKLFAFDDDDNVRDVFVGGPCDDTVKRLAAAVGWMDDLAAFHERGELLVTDVGSSGDAERRAVPAPRPRRPLNIDTLINFQSVIAGTSRL